MIKVCLSGHINEKMAKQRKDINNFTFLLVAGVEDVVVVGHVGDVGHFAGFVEVGLVT